MVCPGSPPGGGTSLSSRGTRGTVSRLQHRGELAGEGFPHVCILSAKSRRQSQPHGHTQNPGAVRSPPPSRRRKREVPQGTEVTDSRRGRACHPPRQGAPLLQVPHPPLLPERAPNSPLGDPASPARVPACLALPAGSQGWRILSAVTDSHRLWPLSLVQTQTCDPSQADETGFWESCWSSAGRGRGVSLGQKAPRGWDRSGVPVARRCQQGRSRTEAGACPGAAQSRSTNTAGCEPRSEMHRHTGQSSLGSPGPVCVGRDHVLRKLDVGRITLAGCSVELSFELTTVSFNILIFFFLTSRESFRFFPSPWKRSSH